ncbi:MAG: HNH endonuclease signature motif containing protein [Kangiellaceae bacterium]|jgi:hypothetical protein|nr:HNH endonuclease signature motif containing protein [Kangiellaceae bacterium]
MAANQVKHKYSQKQKERRIFMKQVEWTDVDTIAKLALESQTRTELLTKLGYAKNYSRGFQKLKHVLELIGEEKIPHLIQKRSKLSANWQMFPQAVKTSYSLSEAITKCNIRVHSNHYKTARRIIDRHGIDISHFRRPTPSKANRRTNNQIFIKGKRVHQSYLRARIIEDNLIEYKCQKCHNNGVWFNETLTLQLDHINGDTFDNRIKNLRFLCPNCHCQTRTWGNKKR